MKEEKMIDPMPIKEFMDSGLLFFINLVLQPLGVSIVIKIDDNKNYTMYPARTKFRGFKEESQNNGYKKLNKYLKENIEKITDIDI